ncbi:uncharacterized protein LOC115620984 [Scaptodrosophila lebanonensis]|uniref:Uncharacterized protein LOC115620984 n=1 Tax=Drosophila lebanonensis TaxID=7225 RepID=A0A6J2T317_DROLE|nr:uncharacterized protein LOC115620984 [Scaptodrosophila lebanonensis]
MANVDILQWTQFYPLYPVKGLRPSSLRKSSFSSSSSINNACPPPPPTPHQLTNSGNNSSSSHQHQNQHQHQHHHQSQHRRPSNSHAHNEAGSLATKPAANLLDSNQLQVNYFEFPPTTRSGTLLLAPTSSTPALNCNVGNGSQYSAVATAAASTACALLATCQAGTTSANNSPKSAAGQHHTFLRQQQQLLQLQRPPQVATATTATTADSMGRREIKRSNTSGSTTRSYDSGSATTNFVGKFTQSVRRIVQDVKDEGAPSGMTRDEVIETNERLRSLRLRLEESYDTAKNALIALMNKYGDSKSQRNIFQRYPMLKLMIKDVIRLETQYWTLVDIPRQEKQETVPSYVMRACSIMEKTQKSGEGVKTSAKLADEAAERRERMERLEHMTTAQIEHENTQLINDLYRLLKKYLGLRHLIRVLKEEYVSSKMYPIFPRYTMLKDMIKGIMHDPDYMEVCHETLANSN